MSPVSWVTMMLAAVLAGWGVPALAVRALVPALESAGAASRLNYRGRQVVIGLGVVWGVWAVSLALVTGAFAFFPAFSIAMTAWFLMAALALGCAFFGLVDDVFGSGEERGFGGHLRALRRGRLTTGGLKLLGIGGLAMFASVVTAARLSAAGAAPGPGRFLSAWLLSVMTIALSANAFNLLDLRPGRALKVYVAVVPFGIGAMVLDIAAAQGWEWAYHAHLPVLAVLLLGPAVATWRYDLGERAMQGDAGANTMGALAGYLLASSLPFWGLAVAASVLLVFNLASERVSYSEVIARTPLLRWLDLLGRREEGASEKEPG